MKVEIFDSPDAASRAAAACIAHEARDCIAARGGFSVAFSGGDTPAPMWRALANERLDWRDVDVFQVDERVAPAGHAERNLTGLDKHLLARATIPAERVHPMPVEHDDLEAAARAYARSLESVAGRPAVLDVVHLGIGADGHTASLVPGDPVLDSDDRDVAVSGIYEGRRRMTLTLPAIDRARIRVWLVLGAQKSAMLARLLDGDRSIPAGRVSRNHSQVFADRAAAGHAAQT
jgi:6-phosphogluconolactonase